MPNLSAEVQALVEYIGRSGVPHRVTATLGRYVSPSNPCDPHSPGSYHCKPGTGGSGLAIDLAGPSTGAVSSELLPIFATFSVVESRLAELYYSGAPYGIRNGKRITIEKSIRDTHWNHVHVAVPKGTVLVQKGSLVPDDPNLPNITGPVEFHPLYNTAGECTGYYIFSTKTGELHSFGPGAKFYGRSEVVA